MVVRYSDEPSKSTRRLCEDATLTMPTLFTHPNIVVLAARRESVRLGGEVFGIGGTRFLERNRLEVARIDGSAVVPADFKRPDAHFWDDGEGRRTRNTEHAQLSSDALFRDAFTRHKFFLCNRNSPFAVT